ncbi:CotH kinase family protein [Actinacidiphila sp. bgisy145]|uniref:CotH kinase family protein n=1 Tax=Actinacidiphila sp. bgisy145 TaxID=3413792 RepID=UPI003EBF0C5D
MGGPGAGGPGPDTPATVRRRRRLRDRLPVRLRHHWKPAAALGVGLAAMVALLGNTRVTPYVTSSSRAEADPITDNVRGSTPLYSASVPHSIELTYQQTDFDKMMKGFTKDGSKDYIEADLTIDGVYLNDVGIRLKGNSTLSSLRGTSGGMPGGRAVPQGAQGASAGAPGDTGGGGGQGGPQAALGGGQDAQGGGGFGGMVQYDLSAQKPEELPWLVKIDEYVKGRAYQGEREISLRPGSNSQVPLNEALALSLTTDGGQKAERYAFTELKVNDRPVATRLMVESPDTDYAESVADGNGVLYKARAGGSFDYRGDDPSAYESSFKQLNMTGSQDLAPVMKLIKWANKASDKEFARDLHRYVDVDSLAAYVASQNLLLNSDDMSGPGKNYLLWYDLDTKKFSVLGWDYNLTFGSNATAGPKDSIGIGGGLPAAGGNTGAGADTGAGTGTAGAAPSALPSGLPSGLPDGGGGGGGGGQGGDAGKGGQGGFSMAQQILKTRFLASDAFDGVYMKAYRSLYRTFYGSGTALKDLKSIAAQASSAEADPKSLDTAVSALRKTVTERATALAKDKEVTG